MRQENKEEKKRGKSQQQRQEKRERIGRYLWVIAITFHYKNGNKGVHFIQESAFILAEGKKMQKEIQDK